MSKTNISKQKQKATHEFFPRSKAQSTDKKTGLSTSFTFNKAPINKQVAFQETRQKVIHEAEDEDENRKHGRKPVSFMSKLYQDDDEFDELKVHGLIDDEDEEVVNARNNTAQAGMAKRKSKRLEKGETKQKSAVKSERSRIGKLALRKDSVGLFAVCEIGKDYLIVNHTRNSKGYIPLGTQFKPEDFKIGQLLVATIIAEVGGAQTGQIYNFKSGKAGLNRKVQLSLDQRIINKHLLVDRITKNMILQGRIETKEAKGYIVDFGLKDGTKGFLKFGDQEFKKDQLVTCVVKTIVTASKILKCDILGSQTASECVQQPDSNLVASEFKLTASHLKPGFLVSGKISKLYENGIEITFLGGLTGTCFIDHLGLDISECKIGTKLNARVITVDPLTKQVTLSCKKHILGWQIQKIDLKVGLQISGAKVLKHLYGQSYTVNLGNGHNAFLHKTNLTDVVAKEESASENEEEKKQAARPEILEVGKQLEQVKIKEINYFDGMPIVSLKKSIFDSEQLNYAMIQVGQYVKAKIEKVNADKMFVTLGINEFVRGNLHLEQMADNPIKVMPPKFTEVGKEINVRVWSVNPSKRTMEFTKKDCLMKDDIPVFKSYKEVKKGDKLYCVVVNECEHGLVVKSFGDIKGLLTFEDIKLKEKGEYDQNKWKVGTVIKAYCLFKKKEKGVALTLHKSKAQQDGEKANNTNTLDAFLPTDLELEEMSHDSKYTTFAKQSKDLSLIGKVNKFKVISSDENKQYFMVKSVDMDKKSKNFVAILPKCMVTNFAQIVQPDLSETTFSGLTLEIYRNQFAVISAQPDLISLRSEIPHKDQLSEQMIPGQTFVGVVNGLMSSSGAISVRFLDGAQKSIKVKDLNVTKDYQTVYHPGKVIRVGVNKLERLCTKEKVINACLAKAGKNPESDLQVAISSLGDQFQIDETLKIGQQIEAEVQLVKDYGIIASIKGEKIKTGFILNDHKLAQKYKPGQTLNCMILDIDISKKIADLKEISGKSQDSGKELKAGQKIKAVVELSKDGFCILAFKTQRNSLALMINQNFNKDQEKNEFEIGEEIEVKINKFNQRTNFYEVYRPLVQEEKKNSDQKQKFELQEGMKFTGQIKSIKQQNIYVQLPKTGKEARIGRLHLLECSSITEFKSMAVGDRIEAKILKISQEGDRTWIELTKKPQHMTKIQGLDEEEMAKLVMSMADLKVGQKYSAMVSSCDFEKDQPINLHFSQPIQLQISPFVRGSVPFNQIVPTSTLAKFGSIPENQKVGQQVEATYIGNGHFSLTQEKQRPIKKGELLTVRFVKSIAGKGITVQTGFQKDHQFGFVPICEITDEMRANVLKDIKPVFAARIIDFEQKTGKPILSARESIVNQKTWTNISPEGTSIAFKEQDDPQQAIGNLRNKILKYGADVALQRNDLALGYVTNIGKAGCFVQIGHNCTVRAGLNELSDSSSFNFEQEMPVGRLVLGRISKVDETNGQKRFHFSTRQSLVVFGVGCVDRAKLAVDDEVEAIIMAVADGKAFGQIKGSYIKLKVKNGSVKVGAHVVAKLTKVTKDKISSNFMKVVPDKSAISKEQQIVMAAYKTVQEEAQGELEELRQQAAIKQNQSGADFDTELVNEKHFVGREEQLAQQIKDLEELEQQSDEEMEVDSKDSDADEMKRLINYDDDDESGEGEDDEDMDDEEAEDEDMEEDQFMDSEEGEAEQSEDDEESSDKDQLVGKKRSLKDRMKEEQEIRAKEKELRSGKYEPKSIEDFERLLVANQDQSYLWIQYIAFMLDNIDVVAARKVAERAVKSVSMSNEQDKLNIWTAYMNLESNFGSQSTLEECTRRALDVNDRKQVYLNLIEIYKTSKTYEYIEPIFKQLVKKYSNSVEIWSSYLEFLVDMRQNKETEFSDAKQVLQRALQAVTKDQHVNLISKFGMLEFKSGNPEQGRTMFEGIVTNYPKRMDIWAIYMDMEAKYGGSNVTQARHLFERCLSNDWIQKKPKKMKLVFQKYMEYEAKFGNKNNLGALRKRVEDYLSKVFDHQNEESN